MQTTLITHFKKTIPFSFLNRKGGTGKTSVSVTCAIQLALQGHKTLLIDCDP
ncbi:MAG: ParA family protein, partial [Clostridia bacterium]|nr:ParA family protein [Clostridia bacterium]